MTFRSISSSFSVEGDFTFFMVSFILLFSFRKQTQESATFRSSSFATPSFFSERLYELQDSHAGSVMNTPTFYPPPNRGEELFNTSRSLHQVRQISLIKRKFC